MMYVGRGARRGRSQDPTTAGLLFRAFRLRPRHQTRESDRSFVGQMHEIRLFVRPNLAAGLVDDFPILPLIPTQRGNDATRAAEPPPLHGFGLSFLQSGVECVRRRFRPFGPKRYQPPTCQCEPLAALVPVDIDHRYLHCRGDVVTSREQAADAADVPQSFDVLLSWGNESATHRRNVALASEKTACARYLSTPDSWGIMTKGVKHAGIRFPGKTFGASITWRRRPLVPVTGDCAG